MSNIFMKIDACAFFNIKYMTYLFIIFVSYKQNLILSFFLLILFFQSIHLKDTLLIIKKFH